MFYPLESIRSQHRNLEASLALEKPTSIILGISQATTTALDDIGISTVFDLASSVLFANATDICLLAEKNEGRFAATGKVPHDVLREGHNIRLDDLPLKPITILNTSASKNELNTLATAMDISSIRDFAAWPPYHVAKELLDMVYNPASIRGALDQEAPADLVPANGEYPTERVQYEVLLFDTFVDGQAAAPVSRPLGSDGALDVSQLISKERGYNRPAIGGILTYTQSWFTKGLALGNLIHSVALGPGESTKIAMIDWSRRVRTSATEDIQQTEQLVSDLSRSRAISEITRAVARETQRGESGAHSFSTATQRGESTGGAGFRDPEISQLFSIPISFTAPGVETSGTSFGTSNATTDSTSWSTSSGVREIAASLAQDIADRTHQAAHSARNRRASIVREVSQEESESISTRTLTNYNHMHALTIEYYEVIQLYRTVVELNKADRCLFIPMKVINFEDIAVFDRFRNVIASVGLTPQVQALSILEPDHVAVVVPHRVKRWEPQSLNELSTATDEFVGTRDSAPLILPKRFAKTVQFGFWDHTVPIDEVVVTLISGESYNFGFRDVFETSNRWNPRLAPDTGDLFNRDKNGYDFSRISRIEFIKKAGSENYEGEVNFGLVFKGDFPVNDTPGASLIATVKVPKDQAKFTVFEFVESIGNADLITHLNNNALYYSQAVWRSLDPATIGILLSKYTWSVGGQKRPLVELVDPTPVAVVANYLVLRISGDDAGEHNEWLQKMNINVRSRREDLVPVPSGGVFAEAVLGRFNSAEKLDITRFWNWQDSPIPFAAPDIAAIQAGSRGQDDNTVPGQLGAPVLNILNPPSVPDPQGLGAILSAIQNGNMFRDMSGLAATIGLAQAGLAGAQQGAAGAAAQAGQNAAVAAQLGAKVAELAAKLVEAYLTSGASLAAGIGTEGLAEQAGGISGQGAKINHGKDMDRRGVAELPNEDRESAGTSDSSPLGSLGKGNEGAAFNAALGRNGGGFFSGLRSIINQSLLGATTKPVLTLGQKVPNKSEISVVGAITAKVVRGTPEFNALVENKNPDIGFKDEEGTGADRMMTPRLKSKLDDLAELVKNEWPGKKLRVTEAWDETNEHAANSIHYEGRAADLTVSDQDNGKLGRLGQLAVDAGFDWVWYENSAHIHVSVTK